MPYYNYPNHRLYQQLLPISLTNRNVPLRWDMNLYLHYRVDHKTMLKSNDQTKSNPKQTVNYNLSEAKKHQKQDLPSEETPPETARAAPLQLPKARKTPGHHPARQRYVTWPLRAAQSMKNTLARGCHAPVTAELPGRRRQRLNQRTTMSTAKGRVSTGGLWNNADLAFKEWKNWNPTKASASHWNDGISSFDASLKCFLANRMKL